MQDRIEKSIEIAASVERVWRAEALRMNDGGWAQQVLNIQAHVQS